MIRELRKFRFITTVLSIGLMIIPNIHGLIPATERDFSTSHMVNSTVDDRRIFTVANAIDYFETLNPLLATWKGERMTIWPCYSTLLMYDPGCSIVGDLAVSWNLSSNGLVWHFKLSEKAVFYNYLDTATVHRATSRDVIYTFWLVQNQTASPLNRLLMTMNNSEVIESMWMNSDFEFNIRTALPYAPLEEALTAIPILPEFIWSQHAWDWPNYDAGVAPCVGSGPFYHVKLVGPSPYFHFSNDTYNYLYRSPTWFEEEERDWHINVDLLYFVPDQGFQNEWWEFNTSVSSIDALLNIPRSTYLSDLQQSSDVTGWCPSAGLEYYLGMNQMTVEMRAHLGGQYASYHNNQLLLNPSVKRAMAMCINRTCIVNTNLSGLASVADSIIPDGNPWHSAINTPIQFNPAAARAMLVANGWAYASDGSPAGPSTTPLCKVGGTDPLSFRFYVYYSSDLNVIGALVANWASNAGIMLDTTYMDYSFIWSEIRQADYDIVLHSRTFPPTNDPSTGVMSYLTTTEIESGPWTNVVYYSNASFDGLYNDSVSAVNGSTRKAIVDQMQTILYDNLSWQAICYVWTFHAANTRTWDNYGNWTQQVLLAPNYALPWLYMRICPAGHKPPVASFVVTPSSGDTNTVFLFDASASENPQNATDSLDVRWDWENDGVWDTKWVTIRTAAHKYTAPGNYDAALEVRDEFSLTNKTSFKVIVKSAKANSVFSNPYAIAGISIIVAVGVATLIILAKRKSRRGSDPSM